MSIERSRARGPAQRSAVKAVSILSTAATLALALPGHATAQAGGAIEGTLALGLGPAKRTASRYATGAAAARSMQSVPAVVYLASEGLDGEALEGGPVMPSVEVVQRDTAFAPATIAVRTGTVVSFPNADPFFHNVFSYAPNARFDLGRYPEGESRQVVFREPGIARIYCELHEFMRAVVVVTEHPFHAVVAEDGSFRLEGVPPGEHTLVAYHPDLGRLEERVVVRAGETARVLLAL